MNWTQVGKELPSLLKETWADWNEDKAPRLGAALSYYTVFSIAPLLIVLLAIAGLVFDKVGFGAQDAITDQIKGTFGEKGAALISTMINNANHRGSGIVATIIGTGTLLLAAGGLFGQLQDALNTIWGVAPKPGQGILAIFKARFLSFTMVLGTGFLLLVSLVLSAALTAISNYANDVLPLPPFIIGTLNFALGFAVITVLFAMIFKVLPDAEIQWKDVWVGAGVTAFLFSLGKLALGLYLAKSAAGSTYGEAGALVLILLWVYYAAQILFFGAEFTQVFARRFGSRIVPSPNAVAVTDDAFARQGIARNETLQSATSPMKTVDVVPRLTPAGKAKEEKSAPDLGFLGAVAAGFLAVHWLGARRRRKQEWDADQRGSNG